MIPTVCKSYQFPSIITGYVIVIILFSVSKFVVDTIIWSVLYPFFSDNVKIVSVSFC